MRGIFNIILSTARIYHVQCVVAIAPLIRGNSRGRGLFQLSSMVELHCEMVKVPGSSPGVVF